MTSIVGPLLLKKGQLDGQLDGGNPKYTVRHGLGWAFIWILHPRSCQGHSKVKSAKKGQNI